MGFFGKKITSFKPYAFQELAAEISGRPDVRFVARLGCAATDLKELFRMASKPATNPSLSENGLTVYDNIFSLFRDSPGKPFFELTGNNFKTDVVSGPASIIMPAAFATWAFAFEKMRVVEAFGKVSGTDKSVECTSLLKRAIQGEGKRIWRKDILPRTDSFLERAHKALGRPKQFSLCVHIGPGPHMR